ncbi:PrpR N-terminal domain-containing protein, partial [Desulfovibrio sp.]
MHPGFCESIIHVGEQPADFCVVTPFKTLAKYAEETAHQLNMRTCIAVSKFDNDVEVALHILNTEKIKLLATRGHALHILRNSTSIPILSIEYSAENFFETLLPFQNSNMRVGHLCFPGQGLKFMRIAQLLGLRGYRLEVEDRNNIEAALKKVREENISLLVGGFGLISKAREEG